jgi:uncharacterized tellurite resistance protein B-like protein
MLDIVKSFFGKSATAGAGTARPHTDHDVRVATCALFLEMGRIDEKFTPAELDAVIDILKREYGLSSEHAEALLAEADKNLKESIDYWHFTNLINENYSTPEKLEIIEMLWRIVFVDGRMDKYENYLMHKLAELLRLSHDQLIDAKLKALGKKP